MRCSEVSEGGKHKTQRADSKTNPLQPFSAAKTLAPRSDSHLGHELEAPFYPGEGLLVQDAGLVRGHDGRVDEAQEHGAAHGADAVLREPLTHHLGGMEGAGTDGRMGGKRGADGGEEKV